MRFTSSILFCQSGFGRLGALCVNRMTPARAGDLIPMKTIVTQNRTMLGRKVDSYTAALGETGWSVSAPSRELAVAELERKLTDQSRHCFARSYRRSDLTKTTWVLFYAQGWQYDIIHDDGGEYPHASSVMLGDKSEPEAREAFAAHYAQYNEVQPALT